MSQDTATIVCDVKADSLSLHEICTLLKTHHINVRRIELMQRMTDETTYYLLLEMNYNPNDDQPQAVIDSLRQRLQ